MRIGEVAAKAGVSVKAVRYYESLGLVSARRLGNGYRDYDDYQLRLIREIHELGRVGIKADQTRPFLDCIVSGNEQGDDCPASLDTYRSAIDEMTNRMDLLAERRAALESLLASARDRAVPLCEFAPAPSGIVLASSQ
ncbi:MAG: MerR family DNA-binding transcriptional regulator [Glaciihabitans sp.]|nr:MerR family DNA-binding transcriptional regulator [Glaciihabitans sp.]